MTKRKKQSGQMRLRYDLSKYGDTKRAQPIPDQYITDNHDIPLSQVISSVVLSSSVVFSL